MSEDSFLASLNHLFGQLGRASRLLRRLLRDTSRFSLCGVIHRYPNREGTGRFPCEVAGIERRSGRF